jgi:hypothetical protein
MIPDFAHKEDLFRWLKTNKHLILTQKKSALKFADPVCFNNISINAKGDIVKAKADPELLSLSEFNVKVAINTTNIRDSHKDVHIPGIWKKSLSENKITYLLQEHRMEFDKIISDRVIAMTKTMAWKELGFDFPGMSEVLIFDSTIEKERNPYMAEQYAKDRVKNHSVGMRYVKIDMAINSESKYDVEEKAVWDKYIDQIVNRDEVEDDGFFFAVTEAKFVEGSAVPMGSNFATPTISIGKTLDEADTVTLPEPLDYQKIIKAINSKLKQ